VEPIQLLLSVGLISQAFDGLAGKCYQGICVSYHGPKIQDKLQGLNVRFKSKGYKLKRLQIKIIFSMVSLREVFRLLKRINK